MMSERVRITDVSPRDGLQNEAGVIPTAEKLRLIELLCATGVDEVEVTSFVSPKWVPQLADAGEVVTWLRRSVQQRWPMLSVLVPNERGMQALEGPGLGTIGKISLFTAASETFSQKNTNASIAESLERFGPVIARARALGLLVRGYVSCVVACPFEGPTAPAKVADVSARLAALGVDEIDLGDTIGAGTPETTRVMLQAVRGALSESLWNSEGLTLHLHDTFGRAAACVRAALDEGVRSFDGAVAGLGGCPYATSASGTRAPGNISTELLVRTVHDEGFATGVDLDALDAAASYANETVSRVRVGGATAASGGATA